MKLKITLFVILFSFFKSQAQHEFMPLAYDYDVLYAGSIYEKAADLHTSVRPLRRSEVYQIINVDSTLQAMRYKGKFFDTWVGRAAFSNHFIEVRTKDFDLSIDPLIDFKYGREAGSDMGAPYTNSRGIYIQGRVGKQVTFMTSISENQARYAGYVNSFVNAMGVVPGQGLARKIDNNAYDFSNAFGVVSYTPSKYFNFSLGQGRVMFGEGHRSLFLGDGTTNYPYLKIETTVWRIKYVNLWTQMLDIRRPVEVNNQYRKKWVSAHYLSYNVNSRLNFSLFEAVTYGSDTNNRGLEPGYFNPIIFFRPIEIRQGSDAANVILGFGSSYKISNGLLAYGQLVLDEFVAKELFNNTGSWRNKFGYQLGLKFLNAFDVKNLHFRLEYNTVRPYTYQHTQALSNYGHYNQPLAHPWGANYKEVIGQVHYRYKRVIADLQLNLGKTGLDTAGSNWGKDVYLSYYDREQDFNNTVAQGVTVNVQYLEARLAYLLNPSYNLRVEGGVVIRSQTPENGKLTQFEYNSPYIYFGLRTGLFNNYFDF